MSGLMSVLAATDGSEHGLGAVVTGAALAKRAGAEFHITTVVEVLLVPPAYIPPGVDAARYEPDFIREAREKAMDQAREAEAATAQLHVRAGFAPQLINKVAEEADHRGGRQPAAGAGTKLGGHDGAASAVPRQSSSPGGEPGAA